MQAAIDLHSHLLPGVDDGAVDAAEALAGVQALRDAGVATAVTTPHMAASVTADPVRFQASMAELDAAWARLEQLASGSGLELERGVELLLDSPSFELDDPRVRLAGGPYVLVEFAHMQVPPGSERALAAIRSRGVIPIVAHPERYDQGSRGARLAESWRDSGAYLQLNGASLLGRYGPAVRAAARALLAEGSIDYVASDFHSRRSPGVAEYRHRLVKLAGEETAELLLTENPRRVVRGEPLLSVPPIPTRHLWSRILELFP